MAKENHLEFSSEEERTIFLLKTGRLIYKIWSNICKTREVGHKDLLWYKPVWNKGLVLSIVEINKDRQQLFENLQFKGEHLLLCIVTFPLIGSHARPPLSSNQDGRLRTGDHILRIGPTPTSGLTSDQVVKVLQGCGSHVTMLIARDPRGQRSTAPPPPPPPDSAPVSSLPPRPPDLPPQRRLSKTVSSQTP